MSKISLAVADHQVATRARREVKALTAAPQIATQPIRLDMEDSNAPTLLWVYNFSG